MAPDPNDDEIEAAPASIEEALLAAIAQDPLRRAQKIAQMAKAVDPHDLVDALSDHADAGRRNAAIEALTRAGARGVPTVIRALRHEDPEVVMFAAGILGKSRDAAAIPHLVRLLEHDDINVAQQAIEALAQLRASVAVDGIVAVLDRDPWLRYAAVGALGEIGDGRAVVPLVALLGDELVDEAVIGALGKIGSADALGHLARILRESTEASRFGACLRAIGEALEQQPNEDALAHMTSWAHLGSDDASDVHLRLIKVLAAQDASSENQALKGAAAALVRALKLRPLYATLVMAGRDPALRELLQYCAVSIGDEMAPSLEVGLAYPNSHVRLLACECVGSLGMGASAPKVARLLRDLDAAVREGAIATLARLGHDASIPEIARLLEDPAEEVRGAATDALGRMDWEKVTDALLERAEAAASIRGAALAVMRQNPHARQRPFIEARLADDDATVRRMAVAALGAQLSDDLGPLEPLLQDPDVEVRREVLKVIPRVRSRHTRQLLLAQMERDPATLRDAVRALGDLGDAAVVPQLLALLGRAPPLVRLATIDALADLRDAATEPMLVRLLSDGEPEIRAAAVQALGRFATGTALRQVVAAARDAEWAVRAAVIEVLPVATDPQAMAALERLCLDVNEFVASAAKRRIEETGRS